MTTMTVRDATWELLRQLGMTTVFGNPGSTELPFLRDFPDDFTYVLGLHEGAVVGMADGFAQASGNAAFVNVHTTSGLGNAMGALVTAWHNRTPLVVTAGQQDRRHLADEPFLSGPLVELARPYVKWAVEPARAADVPATLARAYHLARQAPAGPVFVSVPMDDWDAPSEGVPSARTVSYRSAPDPGDLERIAGLLASAGRPAILAGAGVDRCGAWDGLVMLAERLDAAVWSDALGSRASFPQDHALFQGQFAVARGPLNQQLAAYDVVLAIGHAAFAHYPYIPGDERPPGLSLLHITDDPAEAARSRAELSVVGDIALAVDGLLGVLPNTASTRTPPAPRPPAPQTEATPLLGAAHVWAEIARLLPDDVILVDETPSSRAEMFQHAVIRRPGSFYSTGSGGLGFAMPAAVGIQLARRDRPVVCVTGDGAAMYAIHALWSAKQYDAPVTFIVLDNSQYGILKQFGSMLNLGDLPGLDLPALDLPSLARGFGCRATLVESPDDLAPAIDTALERREPTLINIRIDPTVSSLLGMRR